MFDDDDIDHLLADAKFLAREGDHRGAVVRAREAVMTATSPETKAHAELELDRRLAAERAWDAAVLDRFRLHRANELREAGVAKAFEELETVLEPPWWKRGLERAREWISPPREDGEARRAGGARRRDVTRRRSRRAAWRPSLSGRNDTRARRQAARRNVARRRWAPFGEGTCVASSASGRCSSARSPRPPRSPRSSPPRRPAERSAELDRKEILEMAAKKKKSGRKYGKGASKKVGKAMHERKHGTLRSGSSGKKVKSKKQAIAIGLSEARRAGKKVPKKKVPKKKGRKKQGSKKRSSKRKSSSKKTKK